jgi:hypothetical protein
VTSAKGRGSVVSVITDECCSLHRLGLCPECEERDRIEAEESARDQMIELQIDWERERRLGWE